ncbi:MAG: OmpA family protein [Alphaproteobacteria bacterium]
MGFKHTFAAIVAISLLAGTAQAQELTITNLMGKVPSSNEILDALITPTGIRIEQPATDAQDTSVFSAPDTELAAAQGPDEAFLAVALEVRFDFDSANLTASARQVLDALGEALMAQETANFSFRIEGHTDSVGSAVYNFSLSERRALAVTHYLSTNHGVPTSRLLAQGKGESELYDTANPQGPANRRVQIVNLGNQQLAGLN